MIKKLFTFFVLFLLSFSISGQEALKSIEEEYYDFLSLTGVTERPTLGFRTLSDNLWTFNDEVSSEEAETTNTHIWNNNNLGTTFILWEASLPVENAFTRGINQAITVRIFGPEWFNSYNSDVPFGQNDGALWQGRGYNTSLTAGVRFEGYGVEATFKPQVSWMQNREFEYITPNYSGDIYKDKAEKYGYYGVRNIDAPQRFGPKSFFLFDFADSEIRYSWKTITLGFGTESIWIGPAIINPIIHSNNSASYPKIDFGIRKTKITMPYFCWDLGYLEFRAWWGKLTESDWFDNDNLNNNNLISGLSLYYQFPFINKLTIGINRTMVSKFNDIRGYTLFDIFVPFMEDKAGEDNSDGRASLIIDFLSVKIGLNIFFEWARNDFQAVKDNFLRYPFHTQAWTFGFKKSFSFFNLLFGEISLEITELGCSPDYGRTYKWYSTFYGHHKVTQGYTNKGQWLGAGIGTGGNSQYLGVSFYYPKGKVNVFINRMNPDLDYSWFINTYSQSTFAYGLETYFSFGVNSVYFINDRFLIEASINPIYILSPNSKFDTESWNFNSSITVKIIF